MNLKLNFPAYPLRFKSEDGKSFVWDIIRKKYLQALPEELVRQHLLYFLVHERNVPASLIGVEKGFEINERKKRVDVVVYNRKTQPILLIECKAPEVKLSQAVFDQISVYNLKLKVPHLFVTNGVRHFYCQVDLKTGAISFEKDLPYYDEL